VFLIWKLDDDGSDDADDCDVWSDLSFRSLFPGERVPCAECIGGWL